jgi:hypothetical protein
LLDTVPRIARRLVALVARAEHAIEIAYDVKKIQFLLSCEQFLYLRSH